MQVCLNLNNPKVAELVNSIGYIAASNVISINGEEILDIVENNEIFSKLKNELRGHYVSLFNENKNITIDEMIEKIDTSTDISFWNIFTPEFYDWFGYWMIQYKLNNGINLSDEEIKILSTKFNNSYDKLKDDVSAIVTEEGLPEIVYHGSHFNYHTFNDSETMHHFGTFNAAVDRLHIKTKPSYNVKIDGEYITNTNIKPFFLSLKRIKQVIDEGTENWSRYIKSPNYDGYYYQNQLEDIGSISYATDNKANIKSAVLPDDIVKPLLVEHLMIISDISEREAVEIIDAKLHKFSGSEKIVYFQSLGKHTFGFVTPDGKMFIDTSTKSLNTLFHEFYHVYDKILLSNYETDNKAKSIIDRLNQLIEESGYINKVRRMKKYKGLSESDILAEARAMLIGDASQSKLNEAEHNWLMKLKAVLKDLVDYILNIIGTKSFNNYSPEQILNMTMDEFTNVMTYDMMYDRSFDMNKQNVNKNETVQLQEIDDLFESNPELANAVYEALGFKNKLKTFLGKELEYKDAYISANRLKDFKQYQVLDEKGNDIGSVVIEYRGDKNVILHPKLNISGKGYGKDLYKLISSKFNVEIQEWNEGGISKSDSAKAMWDSLEKEGSAKRIVDEEQGDNFRVVKYNTQITPQQKQQAQQLYSDFLSYFVDNNFDTIIQDLQSKNILDKKCS